MGQPQSADASPAFSSSPEAPPTVSSSPRPVPDSSTHAPTAVPSPDSPSSRPSRDLKFSPLTTDPMDMEIDTLVESPPPSPTETASPAPRRSLAARIFGGARPSLAPTTVDENSTAAFEPLDMTPADPIVPQPIAQVPMQRCSVTTHLRPSFVTAMSLPRLGSKLGRRRSTAAMLIPKESPPAEEPPAPAPAPAVVDVTDPFVKMDSLSSPSNHSAVSSSLGSDSDDEESVDDFGSSSSDEELLGEDDLEVSDWLDEPMDAVLTPRKSTGALSPSHHGSSNSHRGRSFSSVSSTSTNASRSMSGSTLSHSHVSVSGSHHRPSLPNLGGATTSNSSLSTWLSGQEDADDEMDFDYEPAVLTDFMRENMPVYEVMKQVQLFRNLSTTQQEQVMRALKPAKFAAGEAIVQQGTRGSRFYMIAKGEAVVTKRIDATDKEDRMITHLHPGHYFGELALIYDDPRTATVRAVTDVALLYLTQEDFQRIGQVHLSLMLQQVPLLAQLNGRDQDAVLSRLKPANFNDGEYIVRQGDQGTRFYMITRGEAVVSEIDTRPEAAEGQERELTRLYEGHVFGEMALIYSEPRTASVRAVGPVKCLYLTKEDFDKCLTSERFHRFIQHAYVEKATRRAMRLKVQQRAEKESASTPASTPHGGSSSGSLVPPPAPTSPVRATETKKLVRRLKNGQKVVNKYVIKGDLGKGTFGRVKLCQSEEDGKLYAVKIMHRTFVQRMAGKEDQLQDVLRREVAIMKKLNHKNVVKLVEVIDDPSSQKMYLVQEYVQHNLMDEVNRARGLNEEVARKYTRDLLVGLNYLHYHKVIHRDIKPENILVSADGVAKIADFGTARMVMNESESISGAKGTPAFMAPEMFDLDATYQGPSVDVWSLGATLYMMIIGVPPWLADNEIILAERVQHDELTFPADYERAMDPHLKNLLQRMLTKNPKLRISLSDCFTHDWITKEGSDPLVSFSAQLSSEQLLTVSIDESERAIQNIPERIDLSLSEFLEQAHNLVKTRQQTGGSNNSMIHRTGSGHSWPTGGSANGEKAGSSSSLVGGAFEGRSTSSSISSPSRPSAEETTRIIRAWRHHKRVQLMYGHKELSERSRELLLEQKRVAFSAERAKVTEIILPATGPSGSNSAPKMRLQHTTSGPLSPRDRHKSSPGILGSSEMPVGFHQKSLSKKSSFKSAAADEYPSLSDHTLVGFGRTSFTSVSGLSELLSVDETLTEKSFRDSASDADLLKRSLSRKKDFLMVTSEVFRDEDGDFQSRKILFQARDQDFSVASRATTHSKSGRHIGRNSSATMKKTGSRRSLTSNISMGSVGSSVGSTHSNQSQSSSKLEMTGVTAASSDIDLDGIDCVQVTYDGEEDDDEMEYVAEHDSGSGGPHSTSSSGEGSDYSDVEGDVDVDETFNDLIGSSTLENEPDDDDEIAPMGASRSSMPAALLLSPSHDPRHIVQVYVSSKIRENLVLGIRSGYAEAKGSRSYMEDKIVGVARCGFDGYDTGTRDRLETSFASLGFFAVYDGHNGDDTAKFLQSELHHRLFKTPEFAEDPLATISDVCATVDLEILDKQNRSVATPKRKRLDDDDEEEKGDGSCACHEGEDHDATRQSKMAREDGGDDSTRELAHKSPMCLQPISFSGSTAVFVVVTSRAKTPSEDDETSFTEDESDQETVLYVANLGDSRAVLCTASGVAVDLTKDHKASDDEERRGIEKRGGFVHNGRLDGVLALSRGFGDLAHKTEGHLGSVPDVTQRVVAKDDEFLLLASDGLFDVLSSQQAVNFIYRKLRLHGDVQLAAQEMVLKAQQYFAHDNISVVVVALNQHDDGRSVRRSDSSASNVSDTTTPRPAAV